MSGIAFASFLFAAIACAFDAAVYATTGEGYVLGAAIVTGFCAIASLAIGVRR